MLISRRSVLAGLLSPLVPMPEASDGELPALGAELQVLQQHAVALRHARLDGTGWTRWNNALVASVALAEQIGRTPAHDVAGFAIKLRALACEWDDDLEEHQLRRLAALADEMARAA